MHNLLKLLCLLLFFGPVYATKKVLPDSLKDIHHFSIQFQIDRNFRLTNFGGNTLAAQYSFNQQNAIRLGLQIHGSDSKQIAEGTSIQNTKQDKSFSLTVSPQYLHHITSLKRFEWYVGVGPVFNYDYRLDVDKSYDQNVKQSTEKWEIGVVAVWGIEWKVANQLRILAEYNLGVEYNRVIFADHRTGKKITREYAISTPPVKFGISIYF